jgi:tagatose-1,6-bisphosphate aldolase non-catalytic subunit AgaZ/GatZ
LRQSAALEELLDFLMMTASVGGGQIGNTPEALIIDKINSVLEEYAGACA